MKMPPSCEAGKGFDRMPEKTDNRPGLKAIGLSELIALRDTSPLAGCYEIEFPIVRDCRGNLTFIEGKNHIPFAIERAYYLYDVPGGATRAGHAHRQLREVLIAISGSFDVVISDHRHECRVHLNRSHRGLYIGSMVWRELDNFSSGSVCLALASTRYDEADYYRDRSEFLSDLEQKSG